ncbi:unnamed protein product [Mucor hiemalis]
MNCEYCHTNNCKFYCADCIKEKLETHAFEISSSIKEKDSAISQANGFLDKTALIRSLSAEMNKKIMSIEFIAEQQKRIKEECVKKRQRIQKLHSQIRDKKRLLEESLKRKAQFDNYHPDNNPALKAWQRTHKMTVGTRRILVKEITSLFELKRGVIEEPETPVTPSQPQLQQQQQQQEDAPAFGKLSMQMEESGIEDLYICGVTLPTRLIDVTKYPKEELNAPIGLVIHMLGLIVRYLGIKLPFEIIRRGVRPYIRAPNKQHIRKFPLFLEEDDKNFKKFIHGMAMLNYSIVYICHTQGVKIPVNQSANTLQGLMAISRATGLGVQSHALYYQHIRDLDCPIEYDQVLRATTLRYRCSSSLERSQALQSPRHITTNNELHDEFFKVRSSSTPTTNSMNNGDRVHESEDEEEYGLYLDSDEEDDDFDDYGNKRKGQNKQQEQQTQNESWSLVEVAPFIVNGRAVHNGNEGESLFQIGAASIMPGVMNMMESLSGNNNVSSNQGYYRSNTFDNNNWLQRKNKK